MIAKNPQKMFTSVLRISQLAIETTKMIHVKPHKNNR